MNIALISLIDFTKKFPIYNFRMRLNFVKQDFIDNKNKPCFILRFV